MIREKFFKHIEGTIGFFEIRVKVGSEIFRIFCFIDEVKLVILLNGFQKKRDKTPKNEIEKAERLKQKYYEDQDILQRVAIASLQRFCLFADHQPDLPGLNLRNHKFLIRTISSRSVYCRFFTGHVIEFNRLIFGF